MLAVCLSTVVISAHEAEPVEVMIVETCHFENPGRDLHKGRAVDVSTPQRQAELQAVSDALDAFAPTVVGGGGEDR